MGRRGGGGGRKNCQGGPKFYLAGNRQSPPYFHDPPPKGEGEGGKRCQGNRNFTWLETDWPLPHNPPRLPRPRSENFLTLRSHFAFKVHVIWLWLLEFCAWNRIDWDRENFGLPLKLLLGRWAWLSPLQPSLLLCQWIKKKVYRNLQNSRAERRERRYLKKLYGLY